MAETTRTHYIRAGERAAVEPLVAEFRDLLRAGCRASGITAQQLRSMLNADPDVRASHPTIMKLFEGPFALPRPDVVRALTRRLPPRFGDRLRERVEHMEERVLELRRERDTEAPLGGDAPYRAAADLLASGARIVCGPDGSGRSTIAKGAASAYARRQGLGPPLVVYCGGREDGMELTASQVIDAVFTGLGADLLVKRDTADRAAEITEQLRLEPAAIVLEAMAGTVTPSAVELLQMPPGRSRYWITTTWEAPGAFRVQDLDDTRLEGLLAQVLGPHAATLAHGANILINACGRLPVALDLAARLVASTAPLPEPRRARVRPRSGPRKLAPSEALPTQEERARILAGELARLAERVEDVLPALLFLGVQAAAAEHPPDRLQPLIPTMLEGIAHAPANIVYGDTLLAAAAVKSSGPDRVDADQLLYRLERVGVLAPLPHRGGPSRPGWQLASPLLRRAARQALEQLVDAGARPGARTAILYALIRRAVDHSTTMTLPVGPWPSGAGKGGHAGRQWYERHEDELIAAARYAAASGLATQALQLVELLAGHLERRTRWAELDWLTALVTEPVTRGPDAADGHASIDPLLRARLELLRGNVRHKVFRDFGEEQDPHPGSARWHYRRALDLVRDGGGDGEEAAIIELWANAHSLRATYSEPGKTIAPFIKRCSGHLLALEEQARSLAHNRATRRAAAYLLATMGRLFRRAVDAGGTDDLDTPVHLFTEAERLWRKARDEEGRAFALNNRGRVQRGRGSLREAERDYAEALDLFIGLRHVRGAADAHSGLARVYRHKGRPVEAERHIALAIGLFDALGDRRRSADANSNRIRVLHEAGTVPEALRHASARLDYEGLPRREAAYAYVTRARLLVDLGRYPEARRDFERAEAQSAWLDDLAGQAFLLHNRAVLIALMSPTDSARALRDATRAVQLCTHITDPGGSVYARINLAQVMWLGRASLPGRPGDRPSNDEAAARAAAISQLRDTLEQHRDVLAQLAHARAWLHMRLAQYLAQADRKTLGLLYPAGADRDALVEEVRRHVAAAVSANEVLRSPQVSGHNLVARGLLHARLSVDRRSIAAAGDGEAAESLYSQAQRVFEQVQDRTSLSDVHHLRAHLRAGEFDCRRGDRVQRAFLNEHFKAVQALHAEMGRAMPPCLAAAAPRTHGT